MPRWIRDGPVIGSNEDALKKSEPKSANEILAHLKQTTKLGKLLEQAQIWTRWPEAAGARLAPHGQPVGFRRDESNTLVVSAESPVWMHRFALGKWGIIRRINRMARRELVSDIFVVLADDMPPMDAVIPPQDGV